MTKPTVTIERCQQIGHQLNLQVTLTCPVPPVYPKLSVVFTCGERTRIIPMAFTDRDGTTLRAQKTVELAYVFYEPPVGQPMGITFLFTDGVHGYQPVEPDQPYQVTCPPAAPLYPQQQKREVEAIGGGLLLAAGSALSTLQGAAQASDVPFQPLRSIVRQY